MVGNVPVRFVISKRTFYITLAFPSDHGFKLQVWDGKTLWEGSKSGDELHDTVPDGMTYDAYFDLLREAFRVQDKDASRFNYGIARHSTIKTDAVFKWTIKTNLIGTEDEDEAIIPIDMQGTIHLSASPEDYAKRTVQEMMDELLFSHNELTGENGALKKLNDILKSQRRDAVDLLEKLEVEKRAAEVEQFSKFVLVLNTKKAKIAELRQLITEQQAQAHKLQSQVQSARASLAGTPSEKHSIATPATPASYDPLDAPFDSNDVYSLSTPQMSRRKSDLILQGNLKPLLSPKSGTSTKPHNILDLQSPTLASQTSGLMRRQPSHTTSAGRSSANISGRSGAPRVPPKRAAVEDLLSIDSEGEDLDEQFQLPDPKRWKN